MSFSFTEGAPLLLVVGVLVISAVIILLAGSRLAGKADELADATGWGEAVTGAILLGAATSLPGIITSLTTAWEGYAELSISNAVGGIAVQTLFLAVADFTYRRANLEHAAASLSGMAQAALLCAMLAVPLMAMAGPEFTVLNIHPATPILFAGYIYGLRVIRKMRNDPMWAPEVDRETQTDEIEAGEDDADAPGAGPGLWLVFAGLALVTGIAGFAVSRSAIALAEQSGLAQAAIGALITAIITSLPELVTTIAAVRRGALTLALGGIIGGNVFDTLFLAASDIAYRDGSIYHAMTDKTVMGLSATLLMTSVLILGLLRRQSKGIGFEGIAIIGIYVLYAVITMT
ncbi:sodium:calcium antiporter [Maricaulaceae bacterium MS644]